MVYKISDINHLNAMRNLENRPTNLPKKDNKPILKLEIKDSTTSKLLKLCDGLRTKGFDRYADELEKKFLTFKQAETSSFYDVTKETGEDLVDSAHPDGDAKVSDAENDHGVVETVVTQHKKDVDIINKTPTGKSANQNILKMVKLVLADDLSVVEAPSVDDDDIKASKTLFEDAVNYVAKALRNLATLAVDPGVTGWRDRIKATADALDKGNWPYSSYKSKILEDFGMDGLAKSKRTFEKVIELINSGGIEDRLKQTYSNHVNYGINVIYAAMARLQGQQQGVDWHLNHRPADLLVTEFKKASAELAAILSKKPPTATPQLTNVYNKIQEYKNSYDAIAKSIASLRKALHISEVKKLQTWQESPFKDAKLDVANDLTTLLKTNKDQILSVLAKYQGQ